MAGLFRVDVTGVGAFINLMTDMAEIDIDLMVDQIAAVLLSRTRQRFRDQVDPDGSPWTPSAAAALRASGVATGTDRSPGGFLGGFTLFESGALFNSIQLFNPGTPGVRSIGTDVNYGLFHQLGFRNARTGRQEPARPFLGFGAEDVQVAAIIGQRIVEDAIKQGTT